MNTTSPNPGEQYTPNRRAEIRTAGGDYFQFTNHFDRAGMAIETIAHALALQNRFGGHTPEPYSVAEHCWRVSYECDPRHALWGLMHDASEAFIADIVRPAKALLPDYRALEEDVMRKIIDYYTLMPERMPADVHRADMVLCATEARDLMGVDPGEWNLPYPPQADRIVPMRWQMARSSFLQRFRELTR